MKHWKIWYRIWYLTWKMDWLPWETKTLLWLIDDEQSLDDNVWTFFLEWWLRNSWRSDSTQEPKTFTETWKVLCFPAKTTTAVDDRSRGNTWNVLWSSNVPSIWVNIFEDFGKRLRAQRYIVMFFVKKRMAVSLCIAMSLQDVQGQGSCDASATVAKILQEQFLSVLLLVPSSHLKHVVHSHQDTALFSTSCASAFKGSVDNVRSFTWEKQTDSSFMHAWLLGKRLVKAMLETSEHNVDYKSYDRLDARMRVTFLSMLDRHPFSF